MAKIKQIEDIKTIIVHWSESKYINDVLGVDEKMKIEKKVDLFAFDSIIKHASKDVVLAWNKTNLSIKLKNGNQYCSKSNFYLTPETDTLLKLLNDGK